MISNRMMMASIHEDPPILVCADLQTEYLTEGRSHVISDGEVITSRCLELMTLWRENLWPLMHLKRIAQAAWLNPASNLTDWIPELKPRQGELAFEHPLPSAQARRLWLPGLPVTAPDTGNSHIHLHGHLSPGQILVTQLHDPLRRGRSGRTARTHGDAALRSCWPTVLQ